MTINTTKAGTNIHSAIFATLMSATEIIFPKVIIPIAHRIMIKLITA